MKVLVVKSENGQVSKKDIVEGDLPQVLRNTATLALKEWNENLSDFIIMKDMYEIHIPLPLKPQTYEMLKNYIKSRTKSEAIAEIPIFVISFDNEWVESDFKDKKVYVVSPYIDDKSENELLEYAKQVTSPVQETETEEAEEEE
ncbi:MULTISPECIES: DUF2286 domain-containing protein [Sulfurisphaera]|uniref:DUF2286 domain-containing protein n=3 Tax=Sulfurisphaera TaxID=69655 RepID=Q971C6_SULTO|nr:MULTISPECIES: DUF2286 domain-containing protein [Sulfurisphaera]MBB5252407.1 hypothetical protein [Sulfurisphaera ohwakuensis]QGR17138.1 DUF2286 domain-containing protein [Sulfurisphaera ohwakuensis]BAB66494.1 hypothetical protein STK_14270 [Sulfurisphaera tokodaii str. 7]HII73690.1 DUF2286 domain-containing protein [Sulfurisphaera tokodaii]